MQFVLGACFPQRCDLTSRTTSRASLANNLSGGRDGLPIRFRLALDYLILNLDGKAVGHRAFPLCEACRRPYSLPSLCRLQAAQKSCCAIFTKTSWYALDGWRWGINVKLAADQLWKCIMSRHDRLDRRPQDPDEETIAIQAAAIRSSWSESEAQRRALGSGQESVSFNEVTVEYSKRRSPRQE